ncbi:MAG: UV DNA damage repair endonuclease UvsE [Campylobacterales bacterium]|nr:UV DNA damage repair endonuclease UvsE [Campylobacterales bacterium]
MENRETCSMKLGLFCSTYKSTLSTNRTFRLSSLSKERVLETVRENIDDFKKIIPFGKERDISMFRLGNTIVPFASHNDFNSSWWSEIDEILEEGRGLSDGTRITIHPGQFIQLGSKNSAVIENSLKELQYATKLLDILGDESSVITLHLGGINGNKEATIERVVDTVSKNPWLKKYLALENDEYNYTAKETLGACKEIGIGMIFDSFHHSINPSEVSWEEIKKSWLGKDPKIHISSQGDGKVGQHADFIAKKDIKTLKEFLKDDFEKTDIMIEAKHKEFAIERFKEDLKDLY